VNELSDRELMRDVRWVVDASAWREADGDREGGPA